jgi:hypothetical protein
VTLWSLTLCWTIFLIGPDSANTSEDRRRRPASPARPNRGDTSTAPLSAATVAR